MLAFAEGGKPKNPEKNPRNKARTNNKLNPHIVPGRNPAWATLVGGERSHYCAIPAPYYAQASHEFQVDFVFYHSKLTGVTFYCVTGICGA